MSAPFALGDVTPVFPKTFSARLGRDVLDLAFVDAFAVEVDVYTPVGEYVVWVGNTVFDDSPGEVRFGYKLNGGDLHLLDTDPYLTDEDAQTLGILTFDDAHRFICELKDTFVRADHAMRDHLDAAANALDFSDVVA